jgi:hypothetical protein
MSMSNKMQTTSPMTQIADVPHALSLMMAIAFLALVVAAAFASSYYVGAPSFDGVLVGP